MNDSPIFAAQTRSEFGKGAAYRMRRAGLVPAVIYGHGGDSFHPDMPGHELFLIVRGNTNTLVKLKIDGESQPTLVKGAQRHPTSHNILHAGFLVVKAGEKVDVEVPLILVGEAAPAIQTVVEEHTITVKASVTAIPKSIKVNIIGLVAGTVACASDLVLPKGAECEPDAEKGTIVISELAAEEKAAPEAPEAE